MDKMLGLIPRQGSFRLPRSRRTAWNYLAAFKAQRVLASQGIDAKSLPPTVLYALGMIRDAKGMVQLAQICLTERAQKRVTARKLVNFIRRVKQQHDRRR